MASTPPPLGASPHASRTSSPPPHSPANAGRGGGQCGGAEAVRTKVKFCVNHGGKLEALRMAVCSTVGQVAERTGSLAEAPADHKRFIFRGKLLDPGETLGESGLIDGCVVHMVLNESPEGGKAVHVRDSSGRVRTVRVTQDYTVEDVKEEVACFAGAPPPEAQQLAFAGRLLDNAHTLGEYNIQKPSVLQLLPPARPRQLEGLVGQVSPQRWDRNVPVCSAVSIGFCSREPEGSRGRRPILSSLMLAGFELRAFYSHDDLPGTLRCDQGSGRITFRPEEPLQPCTHYRVTVNRNDGMWTTNATGEQERLRGSLREAVASDWVSVRCGSVALPLLPPKYDETTNSLVLETAQPLPPNQVVRVRVKPQHVCGADGESLLPLQTDGILKTSALRWKFHTTHGTSEVSRYEYDNLNSSGHALPPTPPTRHWGNPSSVGPILRRWQEGRVSTLEQSGVARDRRVVRGPGSSPGLDARGAMQGRGSVNGMWYMSGEGGVGREVVDMGDALLSKEETDRGDDDEHSIHSWHG